MNMEIDIDRKRRLKAERMRRYRERLQVASTEAAPVSTKDVDAVDTTVYVTVDALHEVLRPLLDRVDVLEGELRRMEGLLGESSGHEERPRTKVRKTEAGEEWRTTSCPKHGRTPVSGMWVCCGK